MHEVQRRILQAIVEIRGASSALAASDEAIAEKIGADRQEVQDHLDLMEQSGYVLLAKSFGPTYGAWLTAQGRMVLREPTYGQDKQDKSVTPVINILTLIDSQIENLAQTGNSVTINQTVNIGNDEQISKIIAQMVEVVSLSRDIDDKVKRDYALEAEQLKSELAKSRPTLARIRDGLAILGDAEGTLDLASRVAPYFAMLAPLIQQFLQSIR